LAGAVSVGFCPVLALPKAICPAGTLKIAPGPRGGAVLSPSSLRSPWAVAPLPAGHHCAGLARRFIAAVPGAQVIAGDGDVLPAVRATVLRIGAQRDVSVPPPPKDLAGLPIVEVAARGGGNTDTFAVFVSGDGGWARFDHDVADALAAAGVPVAGVDALRYFWVARTPQGFANDLDRMLRYYASHWRRSRVLLIGFSQGADVLPAAVNRLPPATRRTVSLTALLSAGKRADFEFHLSNWLGGSSQGLPIAPEVARMDPTRTLCIYGRDDDEALCPSLPKGAARVVALPGDHHMGNDQARLAATILRTAGVRSQP
jgi:type IV secretory pathway VirJ component